LAQLAGEAALADREFLRKTVEVNEAGRHYLYSEFDRLGLPYAPSHTNFVLVHVGPQAGAVFQSLLQRGVIVRPCHGYDLPEFLRITIGAPAQNARLVGALEAVLHDIHPPA
jgi:histidinol-phosphate aminotransferase